MPHISYRVPTSNGGYKEIYSRVGPIHQVGELIRLPKHNKAVRVSSVIYDVQTGQYEVWLKKTALLNYVVKSKRTTIQFGPRFEAFIDFIDWSLKHVKAG